MYNFPFLHAKVRIEARKLQVTSPAGCKITYLQFEDEFILDVVEVLPAITGAFLAVPCFFAGDCVFFVCEWGRFCLFIAGVFACKSRQFCMPITGKFGKFALAPHVILHVKQQLTSGNYTCDCKQFTCKLREVFAPQMQVKLLDSPSKFPSSKLILQVGKLSLEPVYMRRSSCKSSHIYRFFVKVSDSYRYLQ